MGASGSNCQPVLGHPCSSPGVGWRFFTDLACRTEGVKRRCRTLLQVKADELIDDNQANLSALQM